MTVNVNLRSTPGHFTTPSTNVYGARPLRPVDGVVSVRHNIYSSRRQSVCALVMHNMNVISVCVAHGQGGSKCHLCSSLTIFIPHFDVDAPVIMLLCFGPFILILGASMLGFRCYAPRRASILLVLVRFYAAYNNNSYFIMSFFVSLRDVLCTRPCFGPNKLILGAYAIPIYHFACVSVIYFCLCRHAHMLSRNRVPERSGGV